MRENDRDKLHMLQIYKNNTACEKIFTNIIFCRTARFLIQEMATMILLYIL